MTSRPRFIAFVLACLSGCSSAPTLDSVGEKSEALTIARNGSQPGGIELDADGNYVGGSDRVNVALSGGHGVVRIYAVLAEPGRGASSGLKSRLTRIFQDLRAGAGGSVKAFVRFYYRNPITWKSGAADTVSRIRTDIASVKDVINAYRDVVPFQQAGFLGPWGEWWGGDLEGSDYGSDADLRTLKTGVVGALKEAFPGLPIQLRYPRDIATYYRDDSQIAFHDDAILAGPDDQGTFHGWKGSALWPGDGRSTQAQRDFIRSRNARFGSLNAGEASEQTPWQDCNTLLSYLAEYNIRVFNTQWPSATAHCAEAVKARLTWPAGTPSGGGGGTTPSTGKVLGCWAPDQRPWQYCYPSSCSGDRCKRSESESSCSMYVPSSCRGTWPPAGYPGEEGSASGGSSGSGGSSDSSGGSGGGSSSSGGSSASDSVIGCWAPDQRPWQRCIVSGCSADRCKRTSTDATCQMYRPEACRGTWPPAGYPGIEQ